MTASFDDSCESSSTTTDDTERRGFLHGIAVKARILFRNIRHRKEIRHLADFRDEQLHDIGLNRGDVRSALRLDFSRDPTTYLAEQASSRRVEIRRRGQ